MKTTRDKLERILARLAGRGETERVFLKLYEDAARAAADATDARKRAGISLGPLDGAIVSIKDLFDVAGETTTAGSIVRRDAPPAASDAVVVRRLRQAGAVILGKTNMVEFAFSGLGLNPHYGTPGNAVDPERIPGGSSSGAGVSVAEGTSEISIGSDTGGSVRIPAALNGIVGFKPTALRVPTDGAFPLSYSLDSIGPIGRTVQECAYADAVMAGETPRALVPYPIDSLKIGVPRGRLFTETESMVAQAFEASVSRLLKAGAKVIDVNIDDLIADMEKATSPASIASIEAAEIHADWLDSKAQDFDPRVRGRIALSASLPAPVYIRMMRQRDALIAAMDERLKSIDTLALPATAITAPLTAPLLADDQLYRQTNLLILRNTMVGNLFDLAGISLPIPDQQRPVGLMLMGRNGHDRKLLEIAASVEQIFAS